MNDGFWWKWSVELVVAVGTVSAVIVALFGDWLRHKIPVLRPALVVEQLNPEGVRTTIDLTFEDTTRRADARYYHVRVVNLRRYSPVSQVQVLLLRVEMVGPDGDWKTKWAGEVPLQWSLPQAHPLLRQVGAPATCDVCAVVRDKWLSLATVMTPNSLEEFARRRVGQGDIVMVLTLQARGTETDSPPFRLRLSWNGQWADGDKEMANNMVVKPYD